MVLRATDSEQYDHFMFTTRTLGFHKSGLVDVIVCHSPKHVLVVVDTVVVIVAVAIFGLGTD